MSTKNNPENTTLIYLIAFVVIFASMTVGYMLTQSLVVLVGIFILGWISMVTLMAFQLRNDGVMKKEEFMETFKKVTHKVPPISFFVKEEIMDEETDDEIAEETSKSNYEDAKK